MSRPGGDRARRSADGELLGLRVGRLATLLDGCDLRRITIGGREIVNRIYVASRGPDWSTAEPRLLRRRLVERDGGIEVRFAVEHRAPRIGVRWNGTIQLGEGAVRYAVTGIATEPTRYIRLGMCLLHPAAMAGARFVARTSRGPVRGVLPHTINPQFLPLGGEDHTTMPAFSELALECADGLHLRLRFVGDVFEIEDQRNWGDASFKTYSPPLAASEERVAAVGERVRQGVEIEVLRRPPSLPRRARRSVSIEVGAGEGEARPRIGIGCDRALAALVRPDHLSAAVASLAGLRSALATAASLGVPLELDARDARFGRREAALVTGAHVARVIVAADAATLADARSRIGHVPIAAGSGDSFAGLNSSRPDFWLLDEIVWPLHPQTHAVDDMSVMETPATLADMLVTARLFAGDRPLGIAPLTLAPPGSDDARVAAPFGAAWTLAVLAHASRGGAAWLTCLDRGAGVHPLADFCERPWRVLDAHAEDPRRVVAVELRADDARTLLVANLSSERVSVGGGWSRGTRARRLNADTIGAATRDPGEFRARTVRSAARIVLEAYETVRLDL
jgi:hypothetical protein